MAYVYVQYEIHKELGIKIPFYVGISESPIYQYEEPTGNTPTEIIENFVNQPYIRMYDFGPKSEHGFKAKLSFEYSGEKSDEYQDFLKDKVWKVDYDAEVIYETSELEYIYYIEFLLVKKYGFRHDGGKLFNKIPGGCKLIHGKLEYQFSFDFLIEHLNRGSLTYNPNFYISNDTGYEIDGSTLSAKNVYSELDMDRIRKAKKEKDK